ncbi:hypothetical protein GCM10022214_44810 [Actinomadura miaoliensis]|uniref:Uncharacterized protein n=1 Tax=Actinomadura miaoliensis TaxID=430685 RepID=A0ABP7W4W5_9ACTN
MSGVAGGVVVGGGAAVCGAGSVGWGFGVAVSAARGPVGRGLSVRERTVAGAGAECHVLTVDRAEIECLSGMKGHDRYAGRLKLCWISADWMFDRAHPQFAALAEYVCVREGRDVHRGHGEMAGRGQVRVGRHQCGDGLSRPRKNPAWRSSGAALPTFTFRLRRGGDGFGFWLRFTSASSSQAKTTRASEHEGDAARCDQRYLLERKVTCGKNRSTARL